MTMRERDLQETIRQAASLLGYRAYHTYDSRRSPEGFPDLVIVGHGELFIWELKSEKGGLTNAQAGWINELRNVNGPPHVEVVRPTDLDRCLALLQANHRNR